MCNLSDGERHAISDVCDSWLMTVIEISGGIRNIPEEKRKYIKDIQNICVDEYFKFLENNNSTSVLPNFWRFWKTIHPEFYDFESFMPYNADQEKAINAVKRAIERFDL